MSIQLQCIKDDFDSYEFNPKVLAVLIEKEYLQQYCLKARPDDLDFYPGLLSVVLEKAPQHYLKESCCRMIIKYFGPQASVGDDELEDLSKKIEFINLVKLLM